MAGRYRPMSVAEVSVDREVKKIKLLRLPKVPIARRATKGPLDADDLAEDVPPSSTTELGPRPIPVLTSRPPSPGPASVSGPTFLSPSSVASPSAPLRRGPSPGRARIDLTVLLNPGLYHPISTTHLPPPVLQSRHQPAPDRSLEDLLSGGHFRHAAARAADDLTSGSISPVDHVQILTLFHTRLTCLLLASRPDLAQQEARPLIDWLARHTPAPRPQQQELQSEAQLVPWELRLLLQRLQTTATGDGRRGVMALYALAAECRLSARAAAKREDAEGSRVWKERLQDVGVRVAGELVDMNEVETATRHLESLDGGDDETAMAVRRTLLWLRVGDIEAAKRSLSRINALDDVQEKLLSALVAIGDNEYATAVDTLTSLRAAHPQNELVAQNLAVCFLYTGRIVDASEILESLVSDGQTFPGLLFNLATVYELQTERAQEKKMKLAERVAALEPRETGWERTSADFKL